MIKQSTYMAFNPFKAAAKRGVNFIAAIALVLLVFPISNSLAASKISIGGYDPVSYFSGKPIKGDTSITVKHAGKTYAFASQEAASTFSKNPMKYTPQFGGNCAFGMVFGQRSTVDPKVWKVVDGKLYLHINNATQRRWLKKAQPYIKKADHVWKKIGDG